MGKLRLCFLGNWTTAAEILQLLSGRSEFEIVGVITTLRDDDERSRQVHDVAHEAGLRVLDTEVDDWGSFLATEAIDLLLSVSFGRVLRKAHYARARYRAINLHPSLLPKFRGRDPVVNAIASGAEEIGFTLHYIDEGIDTGNILFQARWPLMQDDTLERIRRKTSLLARAVLVPAILELIVRDRSPGVGQKGASSLAPKIDGVSWTDTVKQIQERFQVE